jgi:transcriptional regulator with XRE-family HTH domain
MDNLTKHIAATLKSLRRERGWSLDKTAQETTVSKAMLGQIEREESSPTIATLWKIASGFQTSFSSFLEELHIDAKTPIHRTGHAQPLNPVDDKIHVTPLFPFDPQLHCEIFVIELLPHCTHLSHPHKPGVIEHVIVVSGIIDVLLNGSWQPLRKGEGLRFNANQAHGYRNSTAKKACFHNIIHYPAKE